jgi:hypothetical protein
MDKGLNCCDPFDIKDDASKNRPPKKQSKKEDLCAAQEHEQDRYKANAVQAQLGLNHTFEQIAPKQHLKINPILKCSAYLDCQISGPSLPSSN